MRCMGCHFFISNFKIKIYLYIYIYIYIFYVERRGVELRKSKRERGEEVLRCMGCDIVVLVLP